MAESFKDQVDALTGFATTENDALSDWLTAGARTILNILPINKLERVASNTNFTSTVDVEDKKILSVLRRDENNSDIAMPCRKLLPSQMGTVQDSSYMEFATTSDPAYIIFDKVLNVFPTVVSSNHSRLVAIDTSITVAHGATNIDNFPDEAENAVVLYAARNAIQRLMNNIQSNSDITTALTAANTELDELQALADKIDTEVALINTQADSALAEIALANLEVDKMAAEVDLDNAEVDLAKAEITESAGLVDSAIDTATAAIKASVDKMNAAIELANLEFDKAETEADAAEAEADDAAVATALGLINTQVDAAVALISTGSGDNAIVNKLALVETNISNAATEIGLAKAEATEIATQTDNSGDINTALIAMNAAVDKFQAASGDPALYGDEDIYTTGVGFTKVKDALDNAQKIVDDGANSPTGNAAGDAATYLYTEEDVELMNVALQIASTEQNRARIHLEEFSTSVNGLQAEINGFATEVTSRVNLTGAKGQAVQAFISTAQAYINEAQANLSLASGYNNAVGAYLNAAQGYAAEIQAYVTSSQMFIGTASNRINVGNAFLAEANARAGEASAYIGEINGRATQIQSQLSVAQGYVQTGAGYSRVADGYGKTAQGYLGTAATYLSAGQGFASTAQGYVNEVTSKINIASSYLQEMQARLAVDNSKYTWYTQQYQMIDAQYKEQIETLRGII